jgi:hypothetical protein
MSDEMDLADPNRSDSAGCVVCRALLFLDSCGSELASTGAEEQGHARLWLPYVVVLVGALLWEVFEWQVLEKLGFVRCPEMWFNRWLSDPIVGLAGVALGLWLVRQQ